MKIRKKEQSFGVLGKIINSVSQSKNDTYSCDYINQFQHTIENDLYYKSGDTFTITSDICGGGFISNSGTTIYFSIWLPKRMDNITSVNLNAFNITVRGITGYLLEKMNMASFNGSITTQKSSGNSLTFILKQDTAFDVTNNTPISFEINSLQLAFN